MHISQCCTECSSRLFLSMYQTVSETPSPVTFFPILKWSAVYSPQSIGMEKFLCSHRRLRFFTSTASAPSPSRLPRTSPMQKYYTIVCRKWHPFQECGKGRKGNPESKPGTAGSMQKGAATACVRGSFAKKSPRTIGRPRRRSTDVHNATLSKKNPSVLMNTRTGAGNRT